MTERRTLWMAKLGFLSLIACAVHAQAKTAEEAYEYLSVTELNQKLTDNQLTSVALVTYLNNRIQSLDKEGPQLKAVIELNPQALADAALRDSERASGNVRSPLHGIPVLIKDNIDTADLMQTSAGSLAMVGLPAVQDAFVIKQLRNAGAIILGKANMSEWAGMRDRRVPLGWSGRGGQGLNPHVLSAGTCGSSSGPAASLAAGYAPISVGTETNGSIICPSAVNGVVGFKPSIGLVSRSGVVPITRRQDTPGPMARTVYDVALLLNHLAGADPTDPPTANAPQGTDYTSALSTDALQGKRIGVVVNDGQKLTVTTSLLPAVVSTSEHSQCDLGSGMVHDLSPQFCAALKTIQDNGATLVPVSLSVPGMSNYFQVLLAGMKLELQAYLNTRSGLPIETLDNLIAYNEQNPVEENYGQQMLEQVNAQTLSEEEIDALWRPMQASFKRMFDIEFHNRTLDAMVADLDGISQPSTAIAGFPIVTVPSGVEEGGEPTSISFIGSMWGDAGLLGLAYAYEQASLKLVHPTFRP
ncbi:amidase family protein [Pseudomonas sp. SWRI154]|uniref:amidase family protein n=1 Tax=Pseudomonas sp. SWRI154 TaxID=2745501 RepID=UPI001646F1FB|nr:amidase family protein [Pseudomonas sp. SWRI154]MBC3364588.1 amidase [Pseudomonas sp. SWRI154]